ncbi:MAG: DUF4339 domain-containing protein, partial [Bdellovibrionota bacterium]
MDAFNDKKWFIYMGNGHEGPYSLGEIQAKMRDSIVTTANYVWAEGMADWKPMTEVTDFASLLTSQQPQQQPEATVNAAPSVESPPLDQNTQSAPNLNPGSPDPIMEGALPDNGDVGEVALESRGSKIKRVMVRLFKLVLIVGFFGGGGYAYFNGYLDPVLKNPMVKAAMDSGQQLLMPHLLTLSEKVPPLQKWISPIAPIDEISQEDYEELKLSARGKVETDGPKISVALSDVDPASPTFYVASNLADGAVFELYIEGNPETLLNHLSFSHRMTATLIKKIGKTGILRFPDGKAAPKGKFTVIIVDAENQPDNVKAQLGSAKVSSIKLPTIVPKNRKAVAVKEVFVGGKADKIYLDRLREFHAKLTEKSVAEIAEVRQILATAESQLASTRTAFTKFQATSAALAPGKVKLKPAKLKALKAANAKTWQDFHTKWVAFNAQLDEASAKWTPEALRQEFFHGALFNSAKTAIEALKKLHTVQDGFVAGSAPPSSFEVQLGEAQASAEATMTALKTKIESVEKLPPS